MNSWSRMGRLLAFTVVLASPALDARAATQAQECAAARLRAAARHDAAKLRCLRRALMAGTAIDPACLLAADATFLRRFSRIQTATGCGTTAELLAVWAAGDACVASLASLLPVVPTTSSTTTTTSTTAPVCPTTASTASTTTTSASDTTTTTVPNIVCLALGSPCGQCGNGICVAPLPGIPIGACVVPTPGDACAPAPPACAADEVCIHEEGGTDRCYPSCP